MTTELRWLLFTALFAGSLWIRVAHAVGFISGLARAPLRPLLDLSG